MELQGLVPYPKTFGARVDGRANTETLVVSLLQNYAVQQERLASSILSSYRNYAKFLTLETCEKFQRLRPDLKT